MLLYKRLCSVRFSRGRRVGRRFSTGETSYGIGTAEGAAWGATMLERHADRLG